MVMNTERSTTNGTLNGDTSGTHHVDAVIVGAGFSGCHLLHLLRNQGLNVKLVDGLDYFGGVWRANWYPGARVDCQMPYYLLSAPELMKGWTWKERFPGGDELRSYFTHVDKVWNLSKDAIFNTRVIEARFDDGTNLWNIKTDIGPGFTCRWFLPCTGSSNKQYWPEFEGMRDFQGDVYHPAAWPRNRPDLLKDRRVAVIGAGSSAVQIVQEAAKEASQLTQFIKTPNVALAMMQRKVSKEQVEAMRPEIPEKMSGIRETVTGLPYNPIGSNTMESTPEERAKIWEANWSEGGFKFNGGSFGDLTRNKQANRAAYDFWLRKTRPRIKDQQKRDILAPLEPPYYLSTKRPSMEQDYYEMVSLDSVDVTNSPIVSFDKAGITTEDGQHRPFDVIVVSTGYDAVIGSLKEMNIIGRNGHSISDHWSDGLYTHLGMSCCGFPNMFFPYGPQAPTSFTAGPPFIEQQNEWIAEVIARAERNRWTVVEATAQAEKEWRKLTLDVADKTLFPQTDSWYMGSNVPGKKREMMVFTGGMPLYFEKCRDALDGMKGFDCIASIQANGVH